MYRYTGWTCLREIGFWLAGLIVAVPVYITVVLSLKTPSEAAKSPSSIPSSIDWKNYDAAWTGVPGTASFGQAFANSVITTLAVLVGLILLGAPAAYLLARRSSALTNGMYWLFLVGIILPIQLGMLPVFVAMSRLGFTGTRIGLILASLGHLLPLAVFLYTGFLRSLPVEYEEAARVDGASRWRVFWQVVFPLVRPVTGTVAILCGLATWNDFFTPLVLVGGTENVTLPVAIRSFVGQYYTQWQVIFAGVVIAVTPILVLYMGAQRHFIRGFASGVRG